MRAVLSLFVLVMLAGCVSTITPDDGPSNRGDRGSTAAVVASAAGLSGAVLPTTQFAIQSYARGQAKVVTVYIEGDGFAWANRNRPSSDPTPVNPLALRLAARDGSAAVAYLARPCQYVSSSACQTRHWTSARFSEEIIAGMNEVVSLVKARAGARSIHLVGYSGGAAVAALIAARRNDVASLRTVAGYLDHVGLNKATGVSPLSGSLDPMQVARSLAAIPQVHYAGADDTLIPSWVAKGFVAAQGKDACARVEIISSVGHQDGWTKAWPKLLSQAPAC